MMIGTRDIGSSRSSVYASCMTFSASSPSVTLQRGPPSNHEAGLSYTSRPGHTALSQDGFSFICPFLKDAARGRCSRDLAHTKAVFQCTPMAKYADRQKRICGFSPFVPPVSKGRNESFSPACHCPGSPPPPAASGVVARGVRVGRGIVERGFCIW